MECGDRTGSRIFLAGARGRDSRAAQHERHGQRDLSAAVEPGVFAGISKAADDAGGGAGDGGPYQSRGGDPVLRALCILAALSSAAAQVTVHGTVTLSAPGKPQKDPDCSGAVIWLKTV